MRILFTLGLTFIPRHAWTGFDTETGQAYKGTRNDGDRKTLYEGRIQSEKLLVGL